jgi:NAD(P) transhydrogenase subunit alpha
MIIGILKEPGSEKRVALLPNHIGALKKLNVEVWVENNAGKAAFSQNANYVAAGALIDSAENILTKSNLILVVSKPKDAALEQIQNNQILVGGLNPLSNKDMVQKLSAQGVSLFSLDFIPRTTRAQNMDVLSSMATISGYSAVLNAAAYLPKFFPMFMSAAGTIKPAKVLILGAGVAGLQSISVARKLGAVVEVFDVRSAVKEEVKSLGGKFIEVEGARDEATAGGYAVEQTEEFKQKQKQLIHDHSITSDVIICTAQIPGKNAPTLLTKETVMQMKPGSVIVDIAASTGGNCELTRNGETIIQQEITIIGKSDYPSDMPVDASMMFGNNIINFLKLIIKPNGSLDLNFDDEIVKGTCITHNGQIVNERYKQLIGLPKEEA